MSGIFGQVKQAVDSPAGFSHFYGAEIKNGNRTLCPFHQERTPSFHVYSNGGCGWKGDIISFVAQPRGLWPYGGALLIAREFRITVSLGQGMPVSSAEWQEQCKVIREAGRAFRKNERNYYV